VQRRKKDDEEEEEEEEESLDEIADKLFGNKIHYVTSNIEVAKKLRKMGHIPVVDGIIPGVTGGLLAQAPLTEQDVTALLAPTNSLIPDPSSSVEILKVLEQLIPSIGITKAAEEMEKEGAALKKMMDGLMQAITAGQSGDLRKSQGAPYGMYQ